MFVFANFGYTTYFVFGEKESDAGRGKGDLWLEIVSVVCGEGLTTLASTE